VFLLFGFGSKQQDLGPGQVHTCPRCGNTSQWERVRQFRQFTVFFVPILRWRRQQLEVCGICGNAIEA
jgi:zinc-ribbon family